MDFEIPTDLINRAQFGFRDGAGLSSFDPKDTILPSLPTVEASISALDSSPSYLRCKYCQGKLLRGLQSLICIYCGEYQEKDLHPHPISFNSTFGYSWLLQSLNLSGSERVGSLAEGSGINGGPTPAEDIVTLSELLDLQISWQDEPKKPESGFDIKASEPSSSMNVGTADVDNFSLESKRVVVSEASEEQPVANEDAQNMVFGDHENLSLFLNVLPLETSVTSSNDVSGDTSSGWNADFQFPDTKVENENPKPTDPFVGDEADLSGHMDTIFGQMEVFGNGNLNDDTDPFPSTRKDWFQDDPFANMSTTTFQQAEKSESFQAKDGLSGHIDDMSSKGLDGDWFSDANWQKSNANKMTTSNHDNFFGTKPHVDVVSSSSLANDLTQNDFLFNVSYSKTAHHTGGSDFDNSNKQNSDTTDWFQDSKWPIGSSSTTKIVANKDDEEFDEWNNFTSSTGNQDSWKQSSKENGTASKNMSELNLLPSTADQQELDFGNFSQSDLYSGSSSNKNPNDAHAVYDIFSVSRNVNTEAGNSAKEPKTYEITPNTTTHPKNDVHVLLSQMHDLSFMLKSELSVPSRPDDRGIFQS